MSEPHYRAIKVVGYSWVNPDGNRCWDVYYINSAGEMRSIPCTGVDELDAYKNTAKVLLRLERRALRRKEKKHERNNRGYLGVVRQDVGSVVSEPRDVGPA